MLTAILFLQACTWTVRNTGADNSQIRISFVERFNIEIGGLSEICYDYVDIQTANG